MAVTYSLIIFQEVLHGATSLLDHELQAFRNHFGLLMQMQVDIYGEEGVIHQRRKVFSDDETYLLEQLVTFSMLNQQWQHHRDENFEIIFHEFRLVIAIAEELAYLKENTPKLRIKRAEERLELTALTDFSNETSKFK